MLVYSTIFYNSVIPNYTFYSPYINTIKPYHMIGYIDLAVQPPRRQLRARFSSLSYLFRASLHISSGNPISISFLTLSSTVCSFAKFSVHYLAVYSYNFLSVLYYLATSASCGSSVRSFKYKKQILYKGNKQRDHNEKRFSWYIIIWERSQYLLSRGG